jgi:HTH-type transcriptional regulator/antitoxin HipB
VKPRKMKAKTELKTLDQIIEEQFGAKGTIKRENFEKGFKSFERSILA